MTKLPQTQSAVQLVGPNRLILNTSKKVLPPGPHQFLCRVEAVGLCFSDLKLLKQFSSHVRKGPILAGIDPQILKQIPSYVPGRMPTVPGHETVVTIETMGPDVKNFKPSRRYLVQTDYRWLTTAGSNAAFGYNFEGALQQYVLMDERVITSPQGQSMLIPVSDKLAASTIALIEPWACVENAYASKERRTLKTDGHMLIVADAKPAENVLNNLFNRFGRPISITWLSNCPPPQDLPAEVSTASDISNLEDGSFDDVIYFGSEVDTTETLFAKLAPHGLFNIVLGGGKFGADIITPVGKIHYIGLRVVGTAGFDPAESMEHIPDNNEIRPRSKINIVGAAGPMGMMHVIRSICQGIEDVTVFAADIDDNRLSVLSKIAVPLADKSNVQYNPYNPTREKIAEQFGYAVIIVSDVDLVADAVRSAAENAIINIFAGIPADVTTKVDLNAYIQKNLYFTGTSGSVLEDMKQVLAKVQAGTLDPNLCVAAVCGLDGAADGIGAIEKRLIPGKIIVYPACKGLKLTPLEQLQSCLPDVAQYLSDGLWNKKAEDTLLEIYQNS